MSGLLGAIDSVYHHVKGDSEQVRLEREKSTNGIDQFVNGNLGGIGAGQVGTLTGQTMGGNSFGNTVGEEQLEPTQAEKGMY